MARFYGNVGFADGSKEISPGVFVENIVDRPYYGDVNRNARRIKDGLDINDDIVLTNEISIVADPYALQNFHAIRYVEWMNSKWKVTSVTVQQPRLVLTMGEIYNEQSTQTP
jgi:hypothetical protein